MPQYSFALSLSAVGILLLVLITACATGERPTATPPSKPPTSTPHPKEMQIDDVFSPPQPFDGVVYVTVKGTLPDSCTQIDSVSASHKDYNEFAVTISTVRAPSAECASEPVPFRESVRICVGDLFADIYTVIVNGESYTFDMDEDFLVPETPDPGS